MIYKFIRGDTVIVLSGKCKNQISKIIDVKPMSDKVLLEGVNIVTKSIKKKASSDTHGFLKKESYIHVSNISHVTDENKPSRIGFKLINGKKLRFLKKTKKVLINKYNASK